jgi:hypothetical protein
MFISRYAGLIWLFAVTTALPGPVDVASAAEGDVGVFCESAVGMRDFHHFSGTFLVPASKDSIQWISAGPKDHLDDFSASTNEYTFRVYAQIGDSTYDLMLHINRVTLELRVDRLKAELKYPDLPVFDPRNTFVFYYTDDHAYGSCKRVKLDAPI